MTNKVEKPRILFLFSDTGGGHRSATEAMIEALNLEFPGHFNTEMVDFFRDYCPWPFHTFPEMYPRMVKAPRFWGAGYIISNGRRRAGLLYQAGRIPTLNGFKRLFREHPADLVVSVHPLANAVSLEALGTPRPQFSVVVTDLVTTHAFWYHTRADLTIVPTQPAYDRALKNKLDPAKVRLVGLPVADRFCQPAQDRAALRTQLGWPQDLPVVLMVGGGDGMGPLEQAARAIADSGLNTALAVIAGRNADLKSRLEAHTWPKPTFIYGFTREMPTLMQAADVLVTKAGPGTLSEAFNASLPVIMYSYLPGQESGNVTYTVEHGAGIWAPKPAHIVSALRELLTNPAALQTKTEACRRLARPEAAREVARLLAAQVGIGQPSPASAETR